MSEVVPQQGFNAGHQAVLNMDGQEMAQAFHSQYECVQKLADDAIPCCSNRLS